MAQQTKANADNEPPQKSSLELVMENFIEQQTKTNNDVTTSIAQMQTHNKIIEAQLTRLVEQVEISNSNSEDQTLNQGSTVCEEPEILEKVATKRVEGDWKQIVDELEKDLCEREPHKSEVSAPRKVHPDQTPFQIIISGPLVEKSVNVHERTMLDVHTLENLKKHAHKGVQPCSTPSRAWHVMFIAKVKAVKQVKVHLHTPQLIWFSGILMKPFHKDFWNALVRLGTTLSISVHSSK